MPITPYAVGQIVKPLEGHSPLRSGASVYSVAIVANMDPFILISSGTDMRWSTKEPENFQAIGMASAAEINAIQWRLGQPGRQDEPFVEEEVKLQVRAPYGESFLSNQLGCGLTLVKLGLKPQAVDLNETVLPWPQQMGDWAAKIAQKKNPSYGWVFEYSAETCLWRAAWKLNDADLQGVRLKAQLGQVAVEQPGVEHVFQFQCYRDPQVITSG